MFQLLSVWLFLELLFPAHVEVCENPLRQLDLVLVERSPSAKALSQELLLHWQMSFTAGAGCLQNSRRFS